MLIQPFYFHGLFLILNHNKWEIGNINFKKWKIMYFQKVINNINFSCNCWYQKL